MTPKRLIDDAEYVQGQIAALQAIVLGLAQQVSQEEFREMFLVQLEMLKIALLGEAVSATRLRAVEDFEVWVRGVAA